MTLIFVRHLCIGVGLWLAGCANPQATLQVQALQLGQQVPRLLEVEGTLRSGDQFLLKVEVPQAAYVYALRPTRDKPERFFPQSGHKQAQPGTSLYIPGAGSYLTVGQGRGRELVMVVASLRQLDDDSLQRLVLDKTGMRARDIGSSEEHAVQGSNQPLEKKEDPPPPVQTGPVNRPGRRYLVQARLDKTHDAVLSFIFNHEPAALPSAQN